MPKIFQPLASLAASGGLGATIIYRTYPTRADVRSFARTLRRRPGPTHAAPTLPQQIHRAIWTDRIAEWHAATTEQRAAYQLAADRQRISLYSAWMQDLPTATGVIWDAGATTWDGGATTWPE